MTKEAAGVEEEANSDLEFLTDDDDVHSSKPKEGEAQGSETAGDGVTVDTDAEMQELIEKMRQPMEKEAPLNTADLIETANPNAIKKKNIKLKDLKDGFGSGAPQELTRKEREFIEAQRLKRELVRKTAAGETVEAKNDLERLAEIRRERGRAKERREEEARKKEELRVQAAKRAEDLDNKLNNKKKSRKGKKNK
eukprot:CAMPEP_0204832170 /NCGR_PEP_ID=MMETSP1346-20131115/12854_1 /ASSEMBLY_ACC=CAM_ASM_000771 /TAXON_ID=215587 /ORGANISM="Aplanochytrium stocchinoi, Strain GSBS06" /LENGTH=194 /DNA_ID=CAMNT_0051963813 /DNA_START=492 /DNA_END=1076 /DNA_ORIENTATION=+